MSDGRCNSRCLMDDGRGEVRGSKMLDVRGKSLDISDYFAIFAKGKGYRIK